MKVEEWIAEKSRHDWSKKAQDDHRHWLSVFTEVTGDKPVDEYGKADGLRFKDVLKTLGMEAMSVPNYNKAMARVGSFFRWAVANTVEEVRNPVEGCGRKTLPAIRTSGILSPSTT